MLIQWSRHMSQWFCKTASAHFNFLCPSNFLLTNNKHWKKLKWLVLQERFCTCKALVGDKYGIMRWICYESCPRCRINRSTCWPVVQHATTVLRMPPGMTGENFSYDQTRNIASICQLWIMSLMPNQSLDQVHMLHVLLYILLMCFKSFSEKLLVLTSTDSDSPLV